MKKITLQSLNIENFKGIKSFEIKDISGDLKIMGDNGTGKTSIADAVAWLFTDKDSSGRKDFAIKPLDASGQERHNLETVVQTTLNIDGDQVSLRKMFKENYSTKRGSAISEFKGHTTDYWIDDVPKKLNEFNVFLKELFDEETYMLLSDPKYFSTMPWKRRREILLEMSGDVSWETVLKTNAILEPLAPLLKKKSIDDIRSMTSESMKLISKDRDGIGPRISELENSIAEATKPDEKNIHQLEKKLKEANNNIAALSSNEALSGYRQRISEINAEIAERKTTASKALISAQKPITAKISALQPKIVSFRSRLGDLEESIKQNVKRNGIAEDAMSKLRDDWATEKKRMPVMKETCDLCGQALPPNMMETAKEKFNQAKANKLKDITDEGKRLSDGTLSRAKEIVNARAEIETITKNMEAATKELESLETELSNLTPASDPEIAKLEKARATVEDMIKTISSGDNAPLDDAKQAVEAIKEEIKAWNKQQATWEAAQKARARIAELMEQEKTISAEHERLAHIMFLTDQYITTHVELLEEKVNSIFKLAKVKMFKQQVNGGVAPMCEVLCDGIPFNSGLNTAAKINVGLDICDTLSRARKVSLPIWIDNRESVNELHHVNSQVISMVVTREESLVVEAC